MLLVWKVTEEKELQQWQSNTHWFDFKLSLRKVCQLNAAFMRGHFPTCDHFKMPNFKGYLEAPFKGQVLYSQIG